MLEILETPVTVLHIVVCAFVVLIVLIQPGKSGGLGAALGGAGAQQVFGGRGAGNFLSRLTWIAAGLFFATSMILAYVSSSTDDSLAHKGPAVVTPVERPQPTQEAATAADAKEEEAAEEAEAAEESLSDNGGAAATESAEGASSAAPEGTEAAAPVESVEPRVAEPAKTTEAPAPRATARRPAPGAAPRAPGGAAQPEAAQPPPAAQPPAAQPPAAQPPAPAAPAPAPASTN